jgi:hypothetical protein
MRRAIAAVAALMTVGALAGCAGLPPGTDGNLTNNWPAMAEAKLTIPTAGTCYESHFDRVGYGDVGVVDCAQTHYLETAYVGEFTGADAQRSVPPSSDSPALPGAYAQCQKGAADYLGGDWHTAMVWLGLVVPSDGAWRGGARWFRCDLEHFGDPFDELTVDNGVLKGDLSGPRTSAYSCLGTTEDKNATIQNATPVDCAAAHQAEFAGTFSAPDVPYPADDAARKKMGENGCQNVVAKFLGYSSASQWNNAAVGWWWLGFDEDQWKLGDRTTQCFAYAYTKNHQFIGSVKGIRDQTPKS